MPKQAGKQDPIPTPEELAAAEAETQAIEAAPEVVADLLACNQLQMRYDYPHLFESNDTPQE